MAVTDANAQKAILVSSTGKFFEFDYVNGTCETKELTNFCSLNVPGFSAAQYKNKVYYNSGTQLYEADLTNPALCRPLSVFCTGNSMTADKNGTLYWVDGYSLFRLPSGLTQPEILGALPYEAAGDLMFYGDKLLMAARPSGGLQNYSLIEVNISSPPNSKLFMETPGFNFFGLMNVSIDCNTNKVYGIAGNGIGGSDFVELDMGARVGFGKLCSINISVFDAASPTESGEVRGVNVNSISIKPQCTGTGLGEIAVAATSASASAKLSFTNNGGAANETGVFPNLTAGTYAIKVTSTDGCSKDTFATVRLIERLSVNTLTIPDTCGALTGAVTITPNSNHTGFRYSLENAAYVVGNIFTGLSSGRKSLKVTETNGCILDTSFIIATYRPPLPVSNVSITAANCTAANGSVVLTFISGVTIQGVRIDGGNLQTSGTFSNLSAGDHALQIITATCNFDTTINIPLLSTPAPVVTYTSISPDCGDKNNGSVQINLSGTVGPYTYSFNNSAYSNNNNYRNLASGTYPVSVKDAQGCTFASTVTVQPYQPLPITIQPLVTPTDCFNEEGGKVIINVFGTESPYFFSIDTRNFLAGQEAKKLLPGNYMVQIRNGNNCLVDSITLLVPEQNIPGVNCDTVYVPTAFTPNADGKNDVLRPVFGNRTAGFVFRVFNRNGQMIFETKEPQRGWNGRFNGMEQPQGVYVWSFMYMYSGGRNRTFKGTTLLLR
ncbi:MAG: gliding motility-associated C-terminal domain-containing protein [Chitinophagaceae bacterium]|nr:gliding motility-associated C-terminal domain-containing protein [Chitinophagaceae bacterium]